MEGKKVLIVAPNFPYPSDYGGAVDIWRRIISLANLGYKVDLVATVKESPKKADISYVKRFVNKIHLVNRENKIIDLFSLYPLQVKSRKKLKDVILNEQYDVTILEGDYVGLILENKTLVTAHFVLRSHNDEKKYFKKLSLSSRSKLNSIYYFSEYVKFNFYINKFLYRNVKNIMFISHDEFNSFVQNKESNIYRTSFLPTPIDKNNFKKRKLVSKNVIFIGSLFMPNNQEAILWYLKNVHPVLSSISNYRFIIVGSTKGYDVTSFIKNIEIYPSLEYHLDVPDLELIYKRASVFVNPMLNGAGVKIKSINAIIEGIPLVSTKIGVEGIGLINGKHFCEANTPQQFSSSIKMLLNSSSERIKLTENAQRFLLENNHDSILQSFITQLIEEK